MRTLKNYTLKIRREAIGENPAVYTKHVHTPVDVVGLAKMISGDSAQESMLVFLLDVKNRVVGFTEAARGGIDSCPVDLRQIFRVAIITGACGIILAHNHPSGDAAPSSEDRQLTRRVLDAAKLLGVTLVDHVIVTDNECTSMSARGELVAE